MQADAGVHRASGAEIHHGQRPGLCAPGAGGTAADRDGGAGDPCLLQPRVAAAGKAAAAGTAGRRAGIRRAGKPAAAAAHHLEGSGADQRHGRNGSHGYRPAGERSRRGKLQLDDPLDERQGKYAAGKLSRREPERDLQELDGAAGSARLYPQSGLCAGVGQLRVPHRLQKRRFH